MSKRGIVITPQIKEIQGGFQGGPLVHPEVFRQHLLYWDEIVMIDLINPIVGFGVDALPKENFDVKVAAEAGLFNTAQVVVGDSMVWSGNIGEYMRVAQQNVANELTKNEKGYWSVGQVIKRFQPLESESVEKDVIISSLNNALPVPNSEIPIDKIIKFREKYADELKAFQKSYDELYLSVIDSSDTDLRLKLAVVELTKGVSDIHKAMKEERIKPVWMSIDTLWDIGINTFIKSVALYTFLDEQIPIPAVAGIVNIWMKVKQARLRQPKKLPEGVRDYEYLAYVNLELKQ